MSQIIPLIFASTLTLIFTLIFTIHTADALVDPPNYNFSLDTFEHFMTGKTLQSIQDKYGKGEIQKIQNQTVYKFYVSHIRYKFPVWVQFQNDVVADFFAKLPSYFLHDVFHASLIKRYGKQQQFKKINEQAIYVWNDVKGIKLTYMGACTITCFPIYLSGAVLEKKDKNLKSLLEILAVKSLETP